MILGRGLDSPREVGVDAATVGVKVTETEDTLTAIITGICHYIRSLTIPPWIRPAGPDKATCSEEWSGECSRPPSRSR